MVEINEDHPNEIKVYWFRASYSKGVSHHHLRLADTQSQGKERESFTVEKGKTAGMPWLEVVGMRKLEAD